MAWFDDLKTPRIKQRPKTESEKRLETSVEETAQARQSKVPEGLWVKCKTCGEILQSKVLRENLYVCQECDHHFRISAMDRILMLTDPQSFQESDAELASSDPLQFDDLKPYQKRLEAAAESTGIRDALISGKATLKGLPFHLAVFEFRFMGGSMGVVVGEKVTRTLERALKERLPAVIVSSSGGARMQEGILSLMQMARTTGVIEKLRREGIPYISILTDPTTGGVAASFAMLGDVILAEPRALIGFAGPRVIEQTIRQSLPEGFQRSEFLLEHGFVDRIVHRKNLSDELHEWMLRLGRRTCRFSLKR